MLLKHQVYFNSPLIATIDVHDDFSHQLDSPSITVINIGSLSHTPQVLVHDLRMPQPCGCWTEIPQQLKNSGKFNKSYWKASWAEKLHVLFCRIQLAFLLTFYVFGSCFGTLESFLFETQCLLMHLQEMVRTAVQDWVNCSWPGFQLWLTVSVLTHFWQFASAFHASR